MINIPSDADFNWWKSICCYKVLSEDFIRINKEFVSWKHVFDHQNLSEEFIIEFVDKIPWDQVTSFYKKVSEKFVKQYIDKVNLSSLCEYHNGFSESFFKEIKDNLSDGNWWSLLENVKFSEDFLYELLEILKSVNAYFCLPKLFRTQPLSEEFLIETCGCYGWHEIWGNDKIKFSDDFIRKFSNAVYWMDLCYNHELSEEIVKEFIQHINWLNLFSNNKNRFSSEFICENINFIDLEVLIRFDMLNNDVIMSLPKEKICLGSLYLTNIGERETFFLIENCNNIDWFNFLRINNDFLNKNFTVLFEKIDNHYIWLSSFVWKKLNEENFKHLIYNDVFSQKKLNAIYCEMQYSEQYSDEFCSFVYDKIINFNNLNNLANSL